MHAAQLRKKLGVMDPSREERYSKRIRNTDDSSNPSPGNNRRSYCIRPEDCVLGPQADCVILRSDKTLYVEGR